MVEKEFPRVKLDDPEVFGQGLKPKMSEFNRKLFVFIKFVLGLCFLPFVYLFSASFIYQFKFIEEPVQGYFWWGICVFLLVYLFVWEPAVFYFKGQKVTEFIFSFLKPLVRVAPFILPVYTLLLLLVYGIFSWVLKDVLGYFMFFIGFTLSLHLVFSAKTLRSKKEDFFKSNYIFGFSLVYIFNLLLLSLFFGIIFEKFSFVNFCKDTFLQGQDFFNALFTQLFVNK